MAGGQGLEELGLGTKGRLEGLRLGGVRPGHLGMDGGVRAVHLGLAGGGLRD